MSDNKPKSITILHGFLERDFLQTLDKKGMYYILEGRPNLENSKYLIDALIKLKIKPTVIADNMAGFLFYQNWVKEVSIGYFEKTEESVLLPVGGLILAVLAKKHNVPVNVHPSNQLMKLMGKSEDMLKFNGTRVVKAGTKSFVPLVEWVDNKYISRVESLV
jgi:methylthioribose-1-phosphate isomerase